MKNKITKRIDWAETIVEIQEKMFLSQAEVAEKCGVVQQTVSTWKNRMRSPGYAAKRKLLHLLAEETNGGRHNMTNMISKSFNNNSEGKSRNGNDTEIREIVHISNSLSSADRQKILDFAKFLLNKK